MGHKVHPKAFRLFTTATWSSRWFADDRRYRVYLQEDVRIRRELRARFREAGVAEVVVERSANAVTVTLHAARPGVIIGRGGQGAEGLKRELRDRFFRGIKNPPALQLNIIEVDRPALNAEVVLQQVITEIEKRLPFRRVMRQAIGRVERAGAQGVRMQMSGRLNGAEIARRETAMSGSVPLHTLRADVQYAQGFARTIYGAIGIKVWIYRGEVFANAKRERSPERAPSTGRRAAPATA
ncbi:30S ribosomal protein S3 [Candidatus Uhrbacteria bacterium]|nr:30S ribosomal protein S3 [Candidatus Uhrbacteria bacterium]